MTQVVHRPGRDALVAAILDFLPPQDPLTLEAIRIALAREIDDAGPDALLGLKTRLTGAVGSDYNPPDPLARRIHHLLAAWFLAPESLLVGAGNAVRVAGAPVILCANHLSYADANVIEVLLHRSAAAAMAGRLTATAGPKVFTNRVRRFSSLCFGTIKVPQSTEVSSDEAVLNVRDVARAARHSIDVARARLAAGDALLLFPEGTRSRTGAMQPMLAGVARYLDVRGAWVLPAGLAGSETLFGVNATTVRAATVVMQAGGAISAEALLAAAAGDRRLVVDAIGLAVAELLPPDYRGIYADAERFSRARLALHDARAAGGNAAVASGLI